MNWWQKRQAKKRLLKLGASKAFADDLTNELTEGYQAINETAAQLREHGVDVFMPMAVATARQSGKASTALINRRLSIDYPTAKKIVDRLRELKVIAQNQGAQPSELILRSTRYNQLLDTLIQIKLGTAAYEQKLQISHRLIEKSGLSEPEKHDLLEQLVRLHNAN